MFYDMKPESKTTGRTYKVALGQADMFNLFHLGLSLFLIRNQHLRILRFLGEKYNPGF